VKGANPQVLHLVRSGGWQSVTNFGSEPVPLPAGKVAVASGPLDADKLSPGTTAWLIEGRDA
jgi:alpha-glucosidase